MKLLLNPFNQIAGFKSLSIGILVLLFTSIVGFFSNTHFPDIISVKISPDYPVWYFIVQGLLNWIVVSIIFYIAAILFSKSSVRIIDIFGTQALARTPYLFASFIGFSDAINVFSKYLLWTLMHQGEPITISVIEIIVAVLLLVLTLLLTIWLITIMFNALKVSANLKGIKLVSVFITGILCATIISAILNGILFQNILK
jgi:hypothetical protein